MFVCPKCDIRLSSKIVSSGIFWFCPQCSGRSAALTLVRKIIPHDVFNAMWQDARSGKYCGKRHCPACGRCMAEVTIPVKNGYQKIDVCVLCQFMWFDASEYENLPAAPEPAKNPSWKEYLSDDDKEKIALFGLKHIEEKYGDDDEDGEPDEPWKYLPAVLSLPVEMERHKLARSPWATWGLAAITTFIGLMVLRDDVSVVASFFGLIPAEFGRYFGSTFLTSFFIHGGLAHLFSNMYFLLIFGEDVEDVLGRGRFLWLITLAALVGGIAHVAGNVSSTIPCIGASGGISGVIAYYALRFPSAKLGLMLRGMWLRVPAFALFMIWFAIQLAGASLEWEGFSHVAYRAHLGGLAVGFLFWSIMGMTEKLDQAGRSGGPVI